jgi:RimJ/RimL family protein N-acetyltransferase
VPERTLPPIPPVLSHGDLTLRAAHEGDIQAIEAGIHDPDVVRWIGAPEGTAVEILELNRRRATAGSPTFCVCQGDDRCLGLVWLNRADDDPSTGALGYWLLPDARGRGLATRAVRLLSQWALERGEVRRLRIVTAVDNAHSRAVAERSGFREAERRRRTRADGRVEDQVVHLFDPSAASA